MTDTVKYFHYEADFNCLVVISINSEIQIVWPLLKISMLINYTIQIKMNYALYMIKYFFIQCYFEICIM